MKQVQALQDIYFNLNNENVLIQNRKAHGIFIQNNVQQKTYTRSQTHINDNLKLLPYH